MVDLRPFRGVRYNSERFGSDLSDLICPPYDVISAADDAALRGRSSRNMVRLEGPSQDPGEGTNDADRYQLAAQRFEAWLADHTLEIESEPAVYGYLHTFERDGTKTARRGMIAALR